MRPSKTRSSEQLTADAKRNFLFVSESTSGNAQDVTEKLDQGLLDFGLLVEPVDKSKYEFVELPAKDTWGLLVRKDHPLAKKGFVTVSYLEKIPLLASRQTMMMREFSRLLGARPAFAKRDRHIQPNLQRSDFRGRRSRFGNHAGAPGKHQRQQQTCLRAVHADTHQRPRGGVEKEPRL